MTVTRCEISADEALAIVKTALNMQIRWDVTAAVWLVLWLLRTDNVIAPAESFAMDRHAATLRKASGDFGTRMSENQLSALESVRGIALLHGTAVWQF